MIESSKLRIAMLSVHSCPVGNLGAKDTGGMSVYIRELARELCAQGHTVDVFTRVHDRADPQVIHLGEGARLIHIRAGEEKDLHKLALYSYLPDFACGLENYRKLNDLRYDVVFSHYWLSCWVGKYVQLWWHVPQIGMFHTLGAIKNEIGIGAEEPELRIVTESESMRDCQRIITSTTREKEAIIRLYGTAPDKIGVVPCGVDLEMFKPGDQAATRRSLGMTDNKILLFVGRIDPLKGLDKLLASLSLMKYPGRVKLVIIGGDEDSHDAINRLQLKAERLGIAGDVSFLGTIKHRDLPAYYNAADICVVPSYYESFGLVALESLACGTPVVATDVGEMSRIIRPGVNGYVVDDNEPVKLAECIDRLLAGIDADDVAEAVIRASVKEYAWSNIAAAIGRELNREVMKTATIA
jgi:D-inositol-3-phosphate glycosyltransferase